MTRQDIAVVGAVALATAAVALGIEFTGRLVADESPQPEIRWPVLKHGAVEITLRASKPALPLETPFAELDAVNNGSQSESFRVTVTLMSQSLASMVSRMPTIAKPEPGWSQELEISLGPGERKTVPVASAEKAAATEPLQPLQQVSTQVKAKSLAQTFRFFTLSDGKTTVSTGPVAGLSPNGSVRGLVLPTVPVPAKSNGQK